MSKFLIGTDPELIILSAENVPITAEGLIKAGKDAPMAISEDVAVHEDNILVEFNVTPSASAMEFLKKNITALFLITKQFLKPAGLTISKECYAVFDEKYLRTEQAMAVGCSPEFDAMTGDIIDPPIFFEGYAGRSAGGHVHIGYEGENYEDSMMMVKLLDLHLAIPSLILDPDVRRREIYGKPSSYRRTEGLKVEYRTLSNFWIFEKTLIEWVYEVVQKVVSEVKSGIVIENELYLKVRDIINNNDLDGARQIIADNNLLLPYGDKTDVLELISNEDSAFLKQFILKADSEIDVIAEDAPSDFEQKTKKAVSRYNEPAEIYLKPAAPRVKDPVHVYEESRKKVGKKAKPKYEEERLLDVADLGDLQPADRDGADDNLPEEVNLDMEYVPIPKPAGLQIPEGYYWDDQLGMLDALDPVLVEAVENEADRFFDEDENQD